MSRMVDALKMLDDRRSHPAAGQSPAPRKAAAATPLPLESSSKGEPTTRAAATPATSIEPRPIRKLERCKLPTADELPDGYFDMSLKISSQIAANYSNVLLIRGRRSRRRGGVLDVRSGSRLGLAINRRRAAGRRRFALRSAVSQPGAWQPGHRRSDAGHGPLGRCDSPHQSAAGRFRGCRHTARCRRSIGRNSAGARSAAVTAWC